LVITGIALGHLYASTMIVDPDVGQILKKAEVLVEEGRVIQYGNRSSGMGSVMGPLTSLVAGVPMLIYNDISAPLLLIEILHLLALLMLLNVVARQIGAAAVPWVLLLFWLNPWRVSEVFLWNPAYLIFTSSLHLWSASRSTERASFGMSFLNVTSVMLSMQLHNSFIILALMSLLLICWRKVKVNWWGAGLAFAVAIASLVPFALEVAANPDLIVGNKNPKAFLFRGLIYVFPTLKGIVYWLRFNSGFFPKDVFKGVELAIWMGEGGLTSALQVFWDVLKYVFAVVTVLFVARWNYQFLKHRIQLLKFWQARPEAEPFVVHYSFAGFLSLLFASMISPIDFNYWHLIILFPCSQLPLYLKFSKPMDWRVDPRLIYCGVTIFMVIANLLMAMGSTKHSIMRI
jgi:hypothetical protein